MTTHVNLMTERARFLADMGRLSHAWAVAIVTLLILMLPLGAWTWQRRVAVVRQHEALEASYEPIRQLSGANRTLGAEAAEFVTHQRAALTLARHRSVVALLGAAAEAVAQTEGAAYLETIHYGPAAQTTPDSEPTFRVTLDVICAATFDVSQLVEALEHAPFTAAKILSSAPAPAAGSVNRKSYVIECEL